MDGMPLTYEEITTFYSNNNLQNMLDNLVNKKYLKLEKPKNLIDGKRKYLGSKKLRGFKRIGPKDGLDYVGGNYAASINFEASLPNLLPEATKTDIGLFLDVGNLWGIDYDQTISNSNDLRSSYGISTAWTSPVGPMVFTFARTLAKATTDITEGFNFRLGTTF
jgi:outer membrane protein insertion porin family